jgi:hypothetical protein
VVSHDLGGLGAKDGSPVSYSWTPPSRIPELLPWLAMLALLLPKRNRSAQVWWVGAPLVLVFALESMFSTSAPPEFFDLFNSAAFGLAAVWLLSPYIQGRGRFLTFLGILFVLGLFSVFSFAVRQPWNEILNRDLNLVIRDLTELLMAVVQLGLVLSVAIILAAWSCRDRYGRLRLSLWRVLWIIVGWIVVLAAMSLQRHGPLLLMTMDLLALSGITFVLLMLFLMLSFANPFFRERLEKLLRLEDAAPPTAAESPVITSK